jgi:hypothetical protein
VDESEPIGGILSNDDRAISRVVVHAPRVRNWHVQLEEIEEAATVAPSDNIGRNIVPTTTDAVVHA